MQVGSDGVQACGSCHFHAGVDNRTKEPAQPQHHWPRGSCTLEARFQTTAQRTWWPATFPSTSWRTPTPRRALAIGIRDANDVMSSMGVSRFKQFVDIRPSAHRVLRSGRQRRKPLAAGYRHRRARPGSGQPGLPKGGAPQHPHHSLRGLQLRQLLGWPGPLRLQRRQRVRPFGPAVPHLREQRHRWSAQSHGLPDPADNDLTARPDPEPNSR